MLKIFKTINIYDECYFSDHNRVVYNPTHILLWRDNLIAKSCNKLVFAAKFGVFVTVNAVIK